MNKDAIRTSFREIFRRDPAVYASAPGRTELGGNHTDHQHGYVLAAAVDCRCRGAAAPAEGDAARVYSEGFGMTEISLGDTSPKAGEKGTPAALVRGIAAAVGCGGFDAYITSEVPPGSGLSSSAAFEILLVRLCASLAGREISPLQAAKIGQEAENRYFGKPCGLMDQLICSVGGALLMDFSHEPRCFPVPFDPDASGFTMCLIDTGADHAALTDEYAAVTRELAEVCRFFGKDVLREVREEDFFRALPEIRVKAGDRAVQRAMHVFAENRRVRQQAEALQRGDFSAFLRLVDLSGRSSAQLLQNIVPAGAVREQPAAFALALCEKLLAGKGVCRIHGGGFAGTVQAYVPHAMLEDFRAEVCRILGDNACRTVQFKEERP